MVCSQRSNLFGRGCFLVDEAERRIYGIFDDTHERREFLNAFFRSCCHGGIRIDVGRENKYR